MWKSSCAKSTHLKKVKEVIRAMILGNAVSINFALWKEIWQTNKDKEVKILAEACIKIQRQHRAKLKRRSENRAAVNVRKQIKYRLLRVCETQETTLDVNESTDQAEPAASTDTEAGSLAVFLLEGAMEKAHDDAEKARLRQVVRIAKSKSIVLPDEPGYGTESVRDEIYRIVDILDPIDRVKLRPKIESVRVKKRDDDDDDDDDDDESDMEEEKREGERADGAEVDGSPRKAPAKQPSVGPGKLAELGSALDDLVSKIASATPNPDKIQKQAELDAYEREALQQPAGTRLHQMAEKAKGFIDRALKPEEKSQALHNKFIVDERITVLDELDSAMELFLNAVDKKRTDDQTW